MDSKYTFGFNHWEKNFQGGISKVVCIQKQPLRAIRWLTYFNHFVRLAKSVKLIVWSKCNWVVILDTNEISRSSHPEVFCKKDVLRNFAKFTGKHLCLSVFFNKIAGLRQHLFLWNTLGGCFKKYRFFRIDILSKTGILIKIAKIMVKLAKLL